ncbi:pannexin-1-like, partial [Anarrhichthys ocellatus]|uniref:pannexin-1-like n=1 Tax=Anarrhichthys ocellatus TaxID=433405 RepID=UPI0012ECBF7C
MAIAHVATEYVFSDFLLKDPNNARYRNVRTELAVDKMVTCVAVGLPLLLISLAFAQEVSVGTQMSCFAPSNFSWRQAAYVDSYCWASVHTHTLPLWLHKFFPYILLLVAVLMYMPALFWRFSAAPLLQSDLGFIMEELDRSYNCAVTLAKRMDTSGLLTPDGDPTEGCFKYPLVEKFLMTKRCSRSMLLHYLLCRGLTLVTLLCACVYLGYYLRLASVTDEFSCELRVGLLASDPSVPEKVHCKLIAVGVFSLLSLVNLVLFIVLIPAVIYAAARPLFCTRHARFLETYQSLPTVSVLPNPANQWDDLSLYLLFLEENVSELKSYKYIKVLLVCLCASVQGCVPNPLHLPFRSLVLLAVVLFQCQNSKKCVLHMMMSKIPTLKQTYSVFQRNSTSKNILCQKQDVLLHLVAFCTMHAILAHNVLCS